MTRALLLCLYVALGVAAAIWLANHPGTVTMEWFGWRVERAPVGILILALIVLCAIVALLYRFWRFLYRGPRAISHRFEENKRRRGYKALSQGMVAVAAGDAVEAGRLARRADGLLNDPPLTLLLSAQAAQLNGDEQAAKRYFETMLESPDTRFLGLRGLVNQAIKEGDETRALEFLRQARAQKPKSSWVHTTLFEMSERTGDYGEARDALKAAEKAGALPAPESREKRASLLLAEALRDEEKGRHARPAAIKKAREARRARGGWLPAALAVARLALAERRWREAAKVIEQAWPETPHPELAELYRATKPEAGVLEQVKRLGKLMSANASHPESRLAMAEAALEAELWGQARRHLEPLIAETPGRRACRMMARLEEAEHGDGEAARRWLERSLAAPADPGWICGSCGARHQGWSADCHACGAFDTLDWRPPPAEPTVAAEPVLSLETAAEPETIEGETLPPPESESTPAEEKKVQA